MIDISTTWIEKFVFHSLFVRFSLHENWLLTAGLFKKRQRCRWIETFSTSNHGENFASTYRYRVYIRFGAVGADANTGIHSSVVGWWLQKISQITGCSCSCTIEMWVMWPKEQKFVYEKGGGAVNWSLGCFSMDGTSF